MPAQQKLIDIAILRTFAIVCVVFFHVYGMMYANHFPASKDIYASMYFRVVQCGLINIAMPLFLFISGYLFVYLLQKGKYSTFGDLLKNKVQRVLLPYFIFGYIMLITTGRGFNPQPLVWGAFWHLWFLPVLFWCFVIYWLVHRYLFKLKLYQGLVLLTVLLAVSLFPKLSFKFLCIGDLPIWLCWFYMGMFIFQYRKTIEHFFVRFRLIYICLAIYFFIQIAYPTEYMDLHWYSLLNQCMEILAVWYIIHNIHWEKLIITKYLVGFSNYSYGIYIFHNWIALYLVSQTMQHMFPLASWAISHTIIFPLIFFIVTMMISLGLSWLTLKTKVGKLLIG